MVSVETIYGLVLNWLTFLILGFLTFSILRNFLRKKTTGTLLLFATYLILFLSRLLSEIQRILQLIGYDNNDIKILIVIMINSPTIVSIFLYSFACRGLVADSEIVRTIMITVCAFIAGSVFTIMIAGIYLDIPEGFFDLEIKQETPELISLSTTATSIGILAIQLVIYLRISISSLILARNSSEQIRKRGFQFIGWGLIIFMTGGFVIGITSSFETGTVLSIILDTITRLIFILSYFMLYIGWTMPDWFRRRIRRKSWFTQQYTSDVTN